jgi:hypothetical protein
MGAAARRSLLCDMRPSRTAVAIAIPTDREHRRSPTQREA